MDCNHMMTVEMGTKDGTIKCLLCKANLKHDPVTRDYVVVEKPGEPDLNDKIADRLHMMLSDALEPLAKKGRG